MGHIKVGEALTAAGNLAGARESYRASLSIAERLSSSVPGNAEWQRDCVVANFKLAGVVNMAGEKEEEDKHLIECMEGLRGMKAKGMFLDPPLVKLLEDLEKVYGGRS